MKCTIAKRNIPAYLDNAVSEQERRQLRSHLRNCRSCADACEGYTQVRDAVRSLPEPEVPGVLTTRLRMLASLEHSRRIGLARTWWKRCTFRLNNLMRPIAVPLAGGFAAAVLLFSAFVPLYGQPSVSSDVPCVVFTQPMIESTGPIGFAPGDAVVDLNIDQQGRIVSYSIVESAGPPDSIRRSIENSLLFTRFQPARLAPNSCPECTVPMSGTVRMVFRSSHIEVRG
jgi:hypothetical protein